MKVEIWKTTYLGIAIEASHHAVSDFNPHGIWCGYLLLGSIPNPEISDLRGTSDAIRMPTRNIPISRQNKFFDQLPWNGGITFYDESVDLHGNVRMKIGCDWAHIWDDAMRDIYEDEYILGEMRFVVDAYRKIYPLAGESPKPGPSEENSAQEKSQAPEGSNEIR